jgi:dTDP-glucose pyrophosphorylase
MNILIPMAGEGSRFKKEGYKIHKPIIPITSHITGKKIPMVVAATMDLHFSNLQNSSLYYIVRNFHIESNIDTDIKKYYKHAKFISIEDITDGQASTCLLAKNIINNDQNLIISACDNGLKYSIKDFNAVSIEADVIVFTFRKNYAVEENPEQYGWVNCDIDNNVKSVSIKKPISDNPLNDHAICGTFWFKKGSNFVQSAEQMISLKNKVNSEYYVDQAIHHCIANGLKVKALEVDDYLCWGTPRELEFYEKTIEYWSEYFDTEKQI